MQSGKIAQRTADLASQFGHQFVNIMNTPGGAGCMAAAVGTGAAAGAGTGAAAGAVGIVGGPTVVVTEGAGVTIGAVGGGASGLMVGMIGCPGGAASGGGGSGNGGGGGGAGGKKVTFGHGARHLEGSGLNQAKVENAIAADVQASTKGASSTGGFWGRVVVDGQTVTYRAMTLSDGSINVGTYTLPRP